MIKNKPKFIKNANCYLVSEINKSLKPTDKGYQKLHWFSTLEEANKFYAE